MAQGNSSQRKRKKKPTPTQRVYVHDRCQNATIVAEDDFTGLVNPFQYVVGTYCTSCQKMVGLGSVAWEDTGETIKSFRKRQMSKSPVFWIAWRQGLGTLCGAILGAALLAVLYQQKNPLFAAFIGALAGAFAEFFFITPKLVPKILGTDYRRKR